jgi:hypothetical protein
MVMTLWDIPLTLRETPIKLEKVRNVMDFDFNFHDDGACWRKQSAIPSRSYCAKTTRTTHNNQAPNFLTMIL